MMRQACIHSLTPLAYSSTAMMLGASIRSMSSFSQGHFMACVSSARRQCLHEWPAVQLLLGR